MDCCYHFCSVGARVRQDACWHLPIFITGIITPRETKARNKKFAGQLPWLDALFGTLHIYKRERSAKYGSDQPMPCRYAAQLCTPLSVNGRCNWKRGGTLEIC